jgi:hypothetical protein
MPDDMIDTIRPQLAPRIAGSSRVASSIGVIARSWKRALPFVRVRLRRFYRRRPAGVEDDDVDPAERLLGGRGDQRGRGGIRGVAGDGRHLDRMSAP